MGDSRLVYSTDGGDRRRDARRQGAAQAPAEPPLPADGVVRVLREKGGRGGKTVTIVRGLPASDMQAIAGDLKRRCATGGAVKQGAIELQGDHRDVVVAFLTGQGRRVKLAGG